MDVEKALAILNAQGKAGSFYGCATLPTKDERCFHQAAALTGKTGPGAP